jgi:glycosyltransferase involved in cell wall biosynthesis
MIARFEIKKNHDTALSAYEDYASETEFPRKLVLCGYGQLESFIKDRIARSEVLSRNVELRGYIASENIPDVLGSSLALILPSTEEQFGIVVTEALAAGVPVIISRVCGATELVVEGETGFIIEPFDSRRLAFAMRFMASDHEGWNSMSEKGRAAARLADTSVFVRAIENITEFGPGNEFQK